jgi:hypothetical protein
MKEYYLLAATVISINFNTLLPSVDKTMAQFIMGCIPLGYTFPSVLLTNKKNIKNKG